VDKFFNNYVSCFITGANVKFLLLHQPPTATPSSAAGSTTSSRASSTSIAANPTSPQTEEAVRNFMMEVYENWVKATMSPFYRVNQEVRSPVFRQRVAAAGRKYL
jgi:trafficking protein particle complex subunit 2